MIQAVRGVLRHLHRTGRVVEDCSRFIQGPRRYRLASIPTTISVDEVRRLLATIDRRSAIGRRNYAILLLLAVYGLRAREVVDLRVHDVDWRGGVIRVRRSKTSRPLVLPLTSAVGNALAAYLRCGRPPTDAREIFVRHHTGDGPLPSLHLLGARDSRARPGCSPSVWHPSDPRARERRNTDVRRGNNCGV
jgi:integrase/recombinase XerD